MAQTGNQATLTNASGWVGVFISIGELTQELSDLDETELDTQDYKLAYCGGLVELHPIPCVVLYDPDTPPPMIGSEQWILTFPVASGANIVGTGFVTKTSIAELVNNDLMRCGFSLQFDGKTGPLFIDPTGAFAAAFSEEFS